jgi:hypothetical protein
VARFPWLKEELGELTEKQRQLIAVLERVCIEEFRQTSDGWPGRPPADCTAIARAFVAKQIYNMPTTRSLLERLQADRQLRRLCGWERTCDIPKEWIFSRAVAEFAASRLPQRVHEALISKSYEQQIIGHNEPRRHRQRGAREAGEKARSTGGAE